MLRYPENGGNLRKTTPVIGRLATGLIVLYRK